MRLPRVLTQNRGFSACVILSLGVGISAAAGVFALVESMRFGRLPFPNADRIEHLYTTARLDSKVRRFDLPPDVVRALEGPNSPVEAVALYQFSPMDLGDAERSIGGWGVFVSPNFQSMLGARMAVGRAIDPGGETPSVVLSHYFWSSAFGSDSSVVGRPLVINGVSHTIVGVAAPEWQIPDRIRLWASPIPRETNAAKPRPIAVLALLKRGMDPEQGRAMIATITASTTFWSSSSGRLSDRIASMSLRDFLNRWMTPAIIILTIIAVLLAFITAVNFAGLLLARGIRRRGEIGVRAALGASVLRLARHIIGETLVLCALGGVVAAILAPLVVDVLRTGFAGGIPAWLEITLGWRTLALSIVATVAFGAIFGLGPALDLARPALGAFLRSAGSTASAGTRATRTRATLVGVQVALATAVLVSLSAMLGKTLTLTRPDPGFDPEPIISGFVQQATGTTNDLTTLLTTARQTPGVAAAALVHRRYLDKTALSVEGDEPALGLPFVTFAQVSDSFFTVLRPPLLAGRLPTDEEHRSVAPVAVISRVVAKRLFDRDAIGKGLRVGEARLTVIGVVENVQRSVAELEPTPSVFVPAGTVPRKEVATELLIRIANPTQLSAPLRDLQLRAANKQLGAVVHELHSVEAAMRQQLRAFRSVTRIVFGIFGIALGLAALGIYGLVAYTAEMRSREMAIREALGATRIRVAGLMLRTAILQALGGVAGGALLASLGALYVRRYNFEPNVAIETTVLALVIIGVTLLLSSIGPLRSAWRRDLSYVLRV